MDSRLFKDPGEQLIRVRELNNERRWGFSESHFIEAVKSIPPWGRLKSRLSCVTLVPYMYGSAGVPAYRRTSGGLWRVAVGQHGTSPFFSVDENFFSSDRIFLAEGVKEEGMGLRWEMIDFRGRRCVSPSTFPPSNRPHAGILAAAVLHPAWVKAMNGYEIPYVFMPGYEVLRRAREVKRIPLLGYNPSDSEYDDRGRYKGTRSHLTLSLKSPDAHAEYWVVPTFIQSI